MSAATGSERGPAYASEVELRTRAAAEADQTTPCPPEEAAIADAAKWSSLCYCDLVCAGLPCQSTFRMGRQRGRADPRDQWRQRVAMLAA
eukprot:4972869-Alexandrium_andersonii.AAC.1